LHSRANEDLLKEDSLPKAVHSSQKKSMEDSFETFRDKAHFGTLQASSDSFQTK